MGRSLAVALYLGLSAFAEGRARRHLERRLQRGKEHPERFRERLGHPGLPRPEGQLCWFHAASVGEAVSLLDLIDELLAARPELNILVTTGTVTSAELLAKRLPPRAIHQFVPVDAKAAVERFLAHWRPDIAIWVESELWPCLIHRTHLTGCPMILANARISPRSARRMRWLGSYAASLLNRFDMILAQDDDIADRIYRLGAEPARITVTGSLKDTAHPLPHDPEALKGMMKAIGGRRVWLAASTHAGEEEIVQEAHRQARRSFPGLTLILVPRHPERGTEVVEMLRAKGWRVAQRSCGEPFDRNTEIYLADTLGEMGLWYRAAPVSFVGGSLVEIGGHNPFEPAVLGSAILHGPHVTNFESAYQRFAAADAAIRVPRPDQLGRALVETLPPDRTAELATAAWEVASEGADVARQVLGHITTLLPAPERAA